MRSDFIGTLKQARELAVALLKHEYGEFLKAAELECLEGVAELEVFDEAIKKVNEVGGLKFPEKGQVCDAIEDELCVQMFN